MDKNDQEKTFKNKAKEFRLKLGLGCCAAAVVSMAMVFLISLDSIFFLLTFVFMFSGIGLVISSGETHDYHDSHTRKSPNYSLRSYFDPSNPFSYWFTRR